MDGMWYWIRRQWSPDLTACDFILWGYMKATVCYQCQQTPLNRTAQSLKQWLQVPQVLAKVSQEACHMTFNTSNDCHFLRFSTHVHTCISN
jgi:hypothetical protein